MKRVLLGVAALMLFVLTHAQVKWDGEALDGQWSNALNWSSNTVPLPGDNIILDNSLLAGNYTVTLPAGNVPTSVNSISISPEGSNNITFILPATSISTTGFTATGEGDAIILNNGAVFRNSSGAANGTPVSVTSAGVVRINNGGRYIHNTPRGHTDFLVSQLSTVAGTENGIFEFDVPSTAGYTVSLSNRTFGRLIFSAQAAGGSKIYNGAGVSPVRINGNLEINSNATLAYGPNTNNIIIQKNCIVNSGGVFNISSSTDNSIVQVRQNLVVNGTITETGSSTGSVIRLNGIAEQSIAVAGSIVNTIGFDLANAAGAVLLNDLALPVRLTISSGNLRLGDNDLITPVINQVGPASPTANHLVTNGSGLVIIPNITSGIIPVGPDDAHYNPVIITNGLGATYSIRVETGINPSIAVPFPAVVDRTWTINSTASSPGLAAIKLGFYDGESLNNFNPALPADVGQWISTAWNVAAAGVSVTNTGSDPMYEASFSNVSAYNTQFIVGNSVVSLPLNYLITCDAQLSRSIASIRWRVREENATTNFELQRSDNGTSYKTIATISTVIGQQEYNVEDRLPGSGKYFYRVKAKTSGGHEKHSNVAVVVYSTDEIWLNAILPNPVINRASLQISTGKNASVELILLSMKGQIIRRWNKNLVRGNNTVTLELDNVEPGIYQLLGRSNGSELNSIRLVKR